MKPSARRSRWRRAQAEGRAQNVNESEVRLNEARINLARVSKLVGVGYSTAAEVDAARAAVDSLEARIRAAREQVRVVERQVALERTNLDSTVIRAPFAGVVISKDAQPGEMVSPVSAGGGFTRTGIGTIVDMGSLEIEVDVNESYINRVKPDQAVTAVLDAYPEWQIPRESSRRCRRRTGRRRRSSYASASWSSIRESFRTWVSR